MKVENLYDILVKCDHKVENLSCTGKGTICNMGARLEKSKLITAY